jgi:hypothetical protein
VLLWNYQKITSATSLYLRSVRPMPLTAPDSITVIDVTVAYPEMPSAKARFQSGKMRKVRYQAMLKRFFLASIWQAALHKVCNC